MLAEGRDNRVRPSVKESDLDLGISLQDGKEGEDGWYD